jgi:hypothetical protein
VAGGWRKLHNEELHNLFSSPNIIRVIKSRRMTRMVHIAHVGKIRNAYKILVGKLRGRDHLEDLSRDVRIIRILEK